MNGHWPAELNVVCLPSFLLRNPDHGDLVEVGEVVRDGSAKMPVVWMVHSLRIMVFRAEEDRHYRGITVW